jgi:hypothetical protein
MPIQDLLLKKIKSWRISNFDFNGKERKLSQTNHITRR